MIRMRETVADPERHIGQVASHWIAAQRQS
jgi:hypothetical protein